MLSGPPGPDLPWSRIVQGCRRVAERLPRVRARARPRGERHPAPRTLGDPSRRDVLHIIPHQDDDPQQAVIDFLNVTIAAHCPAKAIGRAEMPAGGVEEVPEHRAAGHGSLRRSRR